MYLNNLGNLLRCRFERIGSIDDIDRAIETNEKALGLMHVNNPDRAIYLTNLGTALRVRFERMGFMENLDQAIETSKQAVELTPVNHPNRAMYLSNLGFALKSRFEKIGLMEDLDRTIEINEKVVESTPMNHPNRAAYLNNLGIVLKARFERTGSMEDFDRAIEANEQGANSYTSPSSHRLSAAQDCADLLINQRMFIWAKPILEAAIHLLPRIAPRHLNHADAQFNISRFSNLTAHAVSLSLEAMDDPYKALQLLELGRGILANLQLEIHSDISALAADYPKLARRFQELRNQIDSPLRTLESTLIKDQSADISAVSSTFISTRRTFQAQFDDLMAHIRSLHGYENFLQGPSKSELHYLAKGGLIVVFNVSDIRSDAFFITHYQIGFVHLPLLASDAIQDMARHFLKAINNKTVRFYSDSKRELNAVLQWLWDAAVSPILDPLGLTQIQRDGPWPRV